jgi:hypothetical protein
MRSSLDQLGRSSTAYAGFGSDNKFIPVFNPKSTNYIIL